MVYRPQRRFEAGRSVGVAVSATTEVRDITRGTGVALKALVSGSMVLSGRICGCIGRALAWSWDHASADIEATREAQAKADKTTNSKNRRSKKNPQSDEDSDDKEAGPGISRPVKTIRRPVQESIAMLAFGAVLVAGGIATVGAVIWPYMQALSPWRGLIAAGGGIAWMVAAWMVAPPLQHVHESVDEDEDDQPGDEEPWDEEMDDDEDDVDAESISPGNALTRHVLTQMSWLEKTHGHTGGLHVVSLIASAEREGILAPDSMSKKSMREWLKDSSFPVAKSTRQPKGVPVLGSEVDYGVKTQELSAVLGGSATQVLTRLYGAPAKTL